MFIYSSVNGRLGSFRVLAVKNNAAVEAEDQELYERVFSSLGHLSRKVLAGCGGVVAVHSVVLLFPFPFRDAVRPSSYCSLFSFTFSLCAAVFSIPFHSSLVRTFTNYLSSYF